LPQTLESCSAKRENIGPLLPGIGVSCPTGGPSRAGIAIEPLSTLLRTQTACLHEQIEVLLGLPGAIQTLDDYRRWLSWFLGLYEPLEQSLARFSAWGDHGLILPVPNHSARLAADLQAIGIDPAGVSRTPSTLLPPLPTFAHALGALYVLEGSALGGRVILRDIEARIGQQITGATQFFGCRGAAVGQTWQAFKTALDTFGYESPDLGPYVVSGAESVFRAITTWSVPLHSTPYHS
jgi:heme oxygenase (biliverdin-IX-beta and delta-forming)